MALLINELNRKTSNQQKKKIVSVAWASIKRKCMEPQLFHCGFWHIHESNCDSTGVTLELQWVMWGLQYQICEFLEGSEVRLYLTAFICTSPEKGNAMGFACLFACFFILGFESAFGFHGFFGTCECSWNNLIFLQSFFRAGVIIRLKWRFWPSHWQGLGRTFSLFAILGDIHFPGSFRVLGGGLGLKTTSGEDLWNTYERFVKGNWGKQMYQQTCYTGVTHLLQGVENVCWRHLHVMCLAVEKVQVVGTLYFIFSSHIFRGMGVTFQCF